VTDAMPRGIASDAARELDALGFSRSLEQLVRTEGAQVVATMRRLTGDLDLAEDAVADACVAALEAWPVTGIPNRPGAWLTTVARRKALDRIRRESRRDRFETDAVARLDVDEPLTYHEIRDDQLRLIFTCCHPALSIEAQTALALRLLCGLTVPEIAAAFLEKDTTIGQRISRAKSKIAANRIAYRVPTGAELPQRLPAVLAVVHLVFTTGHHAPAGASLERLDLAAEAIRLAELLASLMPDEPEVTGLAVLLAATWARRSTWTGPDGEFVSLRDVDRSTWDREAVVLAADRLALALRRGRVGPYQLQAAMSCVHGLAPAFEDTDWDEIVALYDLLVAITPSAPVKVNRAIAVGEQRGAAVGLAELDTLADPRLDRWHHYHVARADLLERIGRHEEAGDAWRAAAGCEMNEVDARYVARRLSALTEG
jgi:RNA polymerase sigma-70 factor (ECF subfamily)